ncbi:hypothetical protein [Paraburkholderia lacunae]|nr:hypothetical protein [Paraburkholderia lacunae]
MSAVVSSLSSAAGSTTAEDSRRCAVVNIWVDPREHAPGTKNQTKYR